MHPTFEDSAKWIRQRLDKVPRLAWVLGSGFHGVPARLQVTLEVPYRDIPGFPTTAVAGHAGRLLAGTVGGTRLLVLCGRTHFYEGQGMAAVTHAARCLAALGVVDLVLTNAAGGINAAFEPGDFMVLTDHINLMGVNPLSGDPPAGLARFVDLTQAYDAGLSQGLHESAVQAGARVHRGVYLAVAGPSYETPAEIRAFAALGADAVGMSTVPEVLVARQCGLRVAAISCITNLAAGRGREPLSHQEVLAAGKQVEKLASGIFVDFCGHYGQGS